jgi:hypothetical protein
MTFLACETEGCSEYGPQLPWQPFLVSEFRAQKASLWEELILAVLGNLLNKGTWMLFEP